MGLRAAVFCHNGLGDGVVSLVLSNNLRLNGWSVDTYQNVLGPMQAWFPHLPVFQYPSLEKLDSIINSYDWFFVFQNDSSEFIQRLIREGKLLFPDRLKVIYIYPSKHIVNELYYQDSKIKPDLPVAENMRLFCENVLQLPKITKSNGFIPPLELVYRKYKKRIAIHPTSSRDGKNWPRDKYVKLALHLKKKGYQPVFIAGPDWSVMGIESKIFPDIDHLSRYLYESDYFIGNDSGLGHLASALGIPTLTITRSQTLAKLWAPSFYGGKVVAPHPWIPNIRGFRFRDRHWKKLISVRKVFSAFQELEMM